MLFRISERKMQILKLLSEKPLNTKELSAMLKISKAAVLGHIKGLMSENIVRITSESNFAITSKGLVAKTLIENYRKNMKTIERDENFWRINDVSCIPEFLFLRLHELGEYRVIWSNGSEIMRHQKEFELALLEADWVRIVSSVLFPNYLPISAKVCRKADFAAVITESVLYTLWKEFGENLGLIGGKIRIHNSIRLACIVTDSVLCLGLHLPDGTYNSRCGLISECSSAVEWGYSLFEWFWNRAKPLSDTPS
jgi:predicted transcriptional regulator